MEPLRPTVSRETRLLLTIVLISLSMLWVLARVRFPGRPPVQNPVAPVLAQLAPPSALEDIASAVAQLGPRLEGVLTAVEVRPGSATTSAPGGRALVAALRLRDGLAVALTDEPVAPPASSGGLELIAQDSASDLAVLRAPADDTPQLARWTPRGLQYPRFLIAADVSADGTSLRPVFIGSLDSIVSPLWDGPIWAVPAHTDLHKGTFVFTAEGEFAGLAIDRDGRVAIVPADVVIATANRVVQQGNRPPGWIGIEVQPLTSRVAATIGAGSGVVVTWVDPQGPAADALTPLDVIEQIDGKPAVSIEFWNRRLAVLAQGDAISLMVRSGDERRDVRLTAVRRPDPSARPTLGLGMRTLAGVGVEVIRVDPGSAAWRASLQPGDVITTAGDVDAPTAAQLTRLFTAAADTASLPIVVARGTRHSVVLLDKQP
jgi:hypothetical protein